MNHFTRALGVLAVALVLTVSVAPRSALAIGGIGDIVYDPIGWIQTNISAVQATIQTGLAQSINLKEYGLDPVAYALAQSVLNSMTQSVVNWVGSGFNGSPAFVTNIKTHMLQLGDATADSYLAQLAQDGRINSPFKTEVLSSVRRSYYQSTGSGAFGASNPYTLNQSCQNDAAFLSGDFLSGGLDCWRAAWTNPANNPYGSSILATDALVNQVNTSQDERREELRQGNGFLSWRSCPDAANPPAGEPINLTQTETTANCPVQTLGSVTYGVLQDALGAPVARLTSADEINEIISGLLTNLVNDVLNEGLGNVSSTVNARASGNPSGVNTNVVTTLRSSIANQKTTLEPYKAAWQTILDNANAAKTKLDSCNVPAGAPDRTNVNEKITWATNGVSSTVTTLAKLTDIDTRIQAAQSQSQQMTNILAEYQTIAAGLPNSQDITVIVNQSQDIEGASPPTMYQQMRAIAGASCRSLGGT